jgi:hypothetical protein
LQNAANLTVAGASTLTITATGGAAGGDIQYGASSSKVYVQGTLVRDNATGNTFETEPRTSTVALA